MSFKVGPLESTEDSREVEARTFLRDYHGTFEFLLDLRTRVELDPWYRLTERQADAVLRCKERETAPREKRGSGVDLSVLPSGTHYYAVTNESGDLTFLRVDHIVEGGNQWDGWSFVHQVIGGGQSLETSSSRIGKQRPDDTYEGLWPHLLAKVVDDPATAMRRFGVAIGRCGVCGKVLTDPESREYGIGPVCRSA